MSPAVPNSAQAQMQNPKSILADKNHNAEEKDKDRANDHSFRVTFARVSAQKPQFKTSTAGTTFLTNATSSNTKSTSPVPQKQKNDESTAGNDMKRIHDRSLASEKSRKALQKSQGGDLTSELLTQQKSSESLVGSSKQSTTTRKGTKASKSKRYVRAKVKSAGSKSGKKLKKRKNASDKPPEDSDSFKPAKLNDEYATELSKITQILRAVSTFDASTATGIESLNPNMIRVGMTTTARDGLSSSINDGVKTATVAPRRPLSADELKQLLSSITRVVSLHQLPVNGPKANSVNSGTSISGGGGPTSTLSGSNQAAPSAKGKQLASKLVDTKKKPSWKASSSFATDYPPAFSNGEPGAAASRSIKKKGRKVKNPSYVSDGNKERTAKKINSKVSSKSKSRPTIGRRSRLKRREKDNKQERPFSEGGSSVSSTEKDPVQNAAFLRKYFEESTRLANKKSSEDLGPLDGDAEDKPKKKVKKKKSASKKSSKKTSKKASAQSVQSLKVEDYTTKVPGASTSTKDLEMQKLAPAIRNLLDSAYAKINSNNSKSETEPQKEGKKIRQPQQMRKASSTSVSSGGKRPPTKPTSANSNRRGQSETRGTTSRVQPKAEVTASSKLRSHSQGASRQASRQGNVMSKPEEPKAELPELSKIVGGRVTSPSPVRTVTATNTTIAPTPIKTPVMAGRTNAMPPPLKQFETIDDVINSKFSGDTTKMKSIWDKTPYQPMTHERFKDLVSKYTFKNDGEKREERSRRKSPLPIYTLHTPPVIHGVEERQLGNSTGLANDLVPRAIPKEMMSTPGNVLALPKQWEIEEHVAATVKPEPPITQLQAPPRFWAESEQASAYNRLIADADNSERYDASTIAHRARQRLLEETSRQRRTTQRGPVGGPYLNKEAGKDFDIFRLYKDAMKTKNGTLN